MAAIVFVTTELSPFTAGGIGRVLHNILRKMDAGDRARTVVVLVDCAVAKSKFEALFPLVRLISVDTAKDAGRFDNGHRIPPSWAFSDSSWHWRSVSVMLALEKLLQHENVEYLEFPDWGGLAFCTLQERLFRGFLKQTRIAVRLHSTNTALLSFEGRSSSIEDLNVSDLERKSLRDCDVVIAQLPGIAEIVRKLFAFSAEEWNHRVIVHAPPVILDHLTPAVQTQAPSPDQPILFTSKLQPFKRPEIFVRGASAYLRDDPTYRGPVSLVAWRADPQYAKSVEDLIPPDLKGRFTSYPRLTSYAREELISEAAVVVSSAFESFCLAAYEASILGARLILNGTNPAFDDSSPWKDGVNCLKFDGSAAGLSSALARNFRGEEELRPIELKADSWPWQGIVIAEPRDDVSDSAMVSVVVPHFNLGTYLCETLENVLRIDHTNIEIVVVDDASTDPCSVRIVEALSKLDSSRFRVIRLPGNVGLAGARNVGIENARGEYILPLDADDLIATDFVSRAVKALQMHADFDVVVTHAAYFEDGEEPPCEGRENAVDYAVFTGEARTAGLLENRFSTATALFRRSVLMRFRYVEDLRCYEDWSLYMRMCYAGLRFIVSNDAFFFYRRRKNSMVHRTRGEGEHRAEYADLIRTSAPDQWRVGSVHLLLGKGSELTGYALGPTVAAAGGPMRDVQLRTAHLEQLLVSVHHAVIPFEKLFRLPRIIWRRILPLRRAVARLRKN